MDSTELVLGRGEVYFDRFIPGTRQGEGERYIGNTISAQIDKKHNFTEARKSVGGMRVRSFREATSEDIALSFITDNMTLDNAADWLGASESTQTVIGSELNSETVTLKAGRSYQLGKAFFPIIGAKNLAAVSAKKVSDSSYITYRLYVDEVNGRISVPRTATDLNGVTVTVAYERLGGVRNILSQNHSVARGSLRFVANPAHGKSRHYFFPEVLMSARDQLQLKGDEWQSLTFDCDVLANFIVYEETLASTESLIESAIYAEGFTLSEFINVEDLLHGITNIIIPSRGY